MKNLFFYEYPAPYIIDILNVLHNNMNFEVYFIHNNCPNQNFNLEELTNRSSFDFNYLNKEKKNSLRLRELISIIRQNKPEIIVVPEYSLLSMQVLYIIKVFRLKIKIIVRTDDSYDMVAGGITFTKKHKLARNFFAKIVDDIIVVDKKIETLYQKKINKGIYLPIVRDDEKYRELLNISIPFSNLYISKYKLNQKKIVLFVGRLIEVKNVDVLIESFKKMNLIDSVLVIVGDGELRDSLMQSVDSGIDNVIFTGRLEGMELSAWYNVASILVLPSEIEPFGAVVNEALIGGCKCIVSNRAGSSTLIQEGNNGYLVEPNNVDDLKLKLSNLLDSVDVVNELIKVRPSMMLNSFREIMDQMILKI